LLFHDNNGYANAPQCYVCVYISYLVIASDHLRLSLPEFCMHVASPQSILVAGTVHPSYEVLSFSYAEYVTF
jgi:hypothetical protein